MFETRWLHDSVNEDGEVVLEVYLTTAPKSSGNYNFTNFDNSIWATANSSTNGSTQLIFQPDNFQNKQTITLKPVDDLVITGDRSQQITLAFSSTDTGFNGLNETLSVNVIDNDFQRTLEQDKLPSDGNNYIIYDFSGNDKDLNNTHRTGGTPYDLACCSC